MTDKLYYKDPYIKDFEASLLSTGQDEEHGPYVILDRTAFYPTGGGQPCDLGTINGIAVTKVLEVDGEIRHYLEQPLLENVKQVMGIIDWRRRYDHMQQHAGQHILSAVFADRLGCQTIAFHLGADTATIDLKTATISEEHLQSAQILANEIVFRNAPIRTKWVEEDDLKNYPLRKAPKVKENIRLVIIEDVDYNACGGTHPIRTGEVGPIQILATERNQNATRIHFICGWRAIHAFQRKQTVIKNLTNKLSSLEQELPEKVTSLLDRSNQLEKKMTEKEEALLAYEAKDLLKKAEPIGDVRLVARAFLDRGPAECQTLARLLTDQAEDAIVLLVSKSGRRLHVIAARGSRPHENMKALIQDALTIINGRGGGKPERAQGGAETDLSAEGMLAHLLDLVAAKVKK
ncbi:DHHA1 domain-containing protein [Camelliibacillus cellulosilyticus]|uniref:DHHA1 domain-containing protein n=1 Tax=Camelliibacillus cellulosilyticus TaxID=2174486 RepID=A0ABV9GH12_9BACL